MIRVYVAGPYNASNVIGVLNNIKEGTKICAQLLKAGLAPFCPWFDFQFHWYEDLEISNYYNYSIAWLEVADFVLFLPGWEKSKGSLKEKERAEELYIGTFLLENFSSLNGAIKAIKRVHEDKKSKFRRSL